MSSFSSTHSTFATLIKLNCKFDKIEHRTEMPIVRIADFYDNLLEGYYFKEVVRAILDKSGYMVFPYGYESAFSYVKIQLHKGDIKDSPTARKIRSSPDLLVYDMKNKDIMLVEVKSRNFDNETDIVLERVSWYRKYWKDSILAVLIPHGHWFYAQYVRNLEVKEKYEGYNLSKEFERFEEIFNQVDLDTLYRFKWNVATKMGRDIDSPFYFPERDEQTFSNQLLALIEEKQGASIEKLFNLYNSTNLASEKIFTKTLSKLCQEGKIRETNGKFYFG